uniref:tetrahydrofolate synthase n=1 Tax=Mesocestoides corti TaxID=53468 RepID=A0A5K3ET87_MESCO
MFRGIRAPGYLSFIITLAYHIFLAEKVDVAVVEVGLGGRYDHTNVVQHPRVVAVSSIELEHKDKLGSTIREVAWNKAGIFKPAVPGVVATNQPDDAMQVFVEEARSVGCPLFVAPRFVDIWQEIERDGGAEVSQRFADLVREKGVPPVTERNICLALAAFKLWHDQAPEVAPLPDPSITPTLPVCPTTSQISGILSARVVGRFQVVQVTKSVTFFLDCAHTTDSIKHCSNWFNTASEMATSTPRTQIIRILLFTVTGTRDPGPMLELLQVHNFDAVHFSGFKGSNLVRNFGKTPNAAACKASWDRLGTSTPASELTDAEVVPFIRTLKGWDGESRLKLNCGAARPKAIQVLVTGSVYLVGDVLSVRVWLCVMC